MLLEGKEKSNSKWQICVVGVEGKRQSNLGQGNPPPDDESEWLVIRTTAKNQFKKITRGEVPVIFTTIDLCANKEYIEIDVAMKKQVHVLPRQVTTHVVRCHTAADVMDEEDEEETPCHGFTSHISPGGRSGAS
ncbi:hypothetical protein NPIL_416591 [Nephila pilipes]|uniref:Uncharacterized protein n=1 Tax=Nephila pilipes TaxID=299642 RepID=A0A8X6TRN8_NEPPI|nr:hypothetical protein NPIL_416591 [Nephila pilipes]